MASQVDIYNLALGNIGQTDTVASLEERSKARIVCTQYWTLALESMLADFEWPFATRSETLALLSSAQDRGWAYMYQYPNDCMRALHLGYPRDINVTSRNDQRYEVAYNATGAVLLTDIEQAVLTYICRIEDVGRIPPLAVEALAWKLAAMIAMPMTNTRTIAETAENMAKMKMDNAWAAALNEQRQTTDVQSEYIAVRGCDSAYGNDWFPGRR